MFFCSIPCNFQLRLDLVTAERWGFEFLHESFAAFFQTRAVKEFRKDQTEFIESAMVWSKHAGLYSQKTTKHAVVADRAYFDSVTYAAGGELFWAKSTLELNVSLLTFVFLGAMLRMFERVLGSTDFFTALNKYLTKNQFQNANPDTLIDEFVAVRKGKSLCGNFDPRQIFDDFLKNPHYPVVEVWIYNNTYHFSHYSSNPDTRSNWTIPLFAYNLRTKQETTGYLLRDGTVCPENWVNAADPYIFNHNSTSFIRVRYSSELWDQLLKLDTNTLGDSTLLGLLTDEIDNEEGV